MRKILFAIPALILPLPFLPLDQVVAVRATPEMAKTLHLRAPAEPPKGSENADLAMMFWLEEQIAAYAYHLDRETVPATRRQLQFALDQSRADLAKRAARVAPGPHQAKRADEVATLLDLPGR